MKSSIRKIFSFRTGVTIRHRRHEDRLFLRKLPPEIAGALKSLSLRILGISCVEGLLWIIAAFCLWLMIQSALDMLLNLSLYARFLLILSAAALAGHLVFRFGIRPWHRRPTPEETALVAERHWPELRTGLISAVQLSRRPDGSPSLAVAMISQTATLIKRRDLRQAVRWKRLRSLLVCTVVLLGMFGGITWWTMPKSLILLRRAFLSKEPLPTATVVLPVTRNLAIAPGQDVDLSAMASGIIPRSGRVEVVYEGKPTQSVSITPKATEPKVFSIPIRNVQQPFTYRFYLNDGVGDFWKVSLLHPPMVTRLNFEATPPSYAELQPATLPPSGLKLLAGSTLKISGTSSQPLASAKLLLSGKDPIAISMKPENPDRTGFSAILRIPKEGIESLSLELTNQDHVISQKNTAYPVTVIPDQQPKVEMAESQPEKESMVPSQKPRLRFEVSDDFKVKDIYLCILPMSSLGAGETPDPSKAKQFPIPLPKSASRISIDFEWKDAGNSVDWSEGQSYLCWVKAVDNNDVTGPGIGYSRPLEWNLVSPQAKREELSEGLRKNAESIRDLSRNQEGVRKSLESILKQEKEK